MIVFPLSRSPELKVATASSRDAVVPMFVRSRPSLTRFDDLTQLVAVGLDDEVDRPAVRREGLDRADDGHQAFPQP